MLGALQAWLATITLVQVLDWGLVVLLLGLALFLTRKSRAVLLVRGLILLIGLKVISRPLVVFSQLLDLLLVGSAVAMGVLFQPELRRLLEQLGRAITWLNQLVPLEADGGGDPAETDDFLEELVQAVRELSQNRTGALIVIEPEQPIDQRIFTDRGVAINARLSRELLQTIFQTSTLLHDGAVVIHANRVKAAGVILPVSDRVASRQLGTRHRAAMGISEQTNCICVVVSEETGSISLAEAGRLERPLTSSKLRELLIQRLRPPKLPKAESALQRPALVLDQARTWWHNRMVPFRKTLTKE